jgi:protease I
MSKKVLMIIAPQNYRDEELTVPKGVFQKKGCEVVIASKGIEDAIGMLGGKTYVDLDMAEVIPTDYDAIVFVGGGGANVYFNDERAFDIAKDAVAENKVLGAICIAPSILANAGVLKGKNVTASPSEEANLKQKGANYTGKPVEVDGKIVTAIGPNAAKEFGEEIMKKLTEN